MRRLRDPFNERRESKPFTASTPEFVGRLASERDLQKGRVIFQKLASLVGRDKIISRLGEEMDMDTGIISAWMNDKNLPPREAWAGLVRVLKSFGPPPIQSIKFMRAALDRFSRIYGENDLLAVLAEKSRTDVSALENWAENNKFFYAERWDRVERTWRLFSERPALVRDKIFEYRRDRRKPVVRDEHTVRRINKTA